MFGEFSIEFFNNKLGLGDFLSCFFEIFSLYKIIAGVVSKLAESRIDLHFFFPFNGGYLNFSLEEGLFCHLTHLVVLSLQFHASLLLVFMLAD